MFVLSRYWHARLCDFQPEIGAANRGKFAQGDPVHSSAIPRESHEIARLRQTLATLERADIIIVVQPTEAAYASRPHRSEEIAGTQRDILGQLHADDFALASSWHHVNAISGSINARGLENFTLMPRCVASACATPSCKPCLHSRSR